MNSHKTLISDHYPHLIEQISNLLNLSLSDIKNRYTEYPFCLIDYFEKDMTEKSIELRFDKEEVTITCTFNPEGKCNRVVLFSDKNETIEKLTHYLKDKYEYDFVENRWNVLGYYVSIKETSYSPYDMYMLFLLLNDLFNTY